MIHRFVVGALIVLGIVACGNSGTNPPQKPFIRTDRDSLGFGLEFGGDAGSGGTCIGAAPQDSILIQNKGLDPLIFTLPLTRTGDTEFVVDGPVDSTGAAATQVPGLGVAFLRVVFRPTAARDYAGTVVIVSNASNTPSKTIGLAGRGLPPSACGVRDGGP